MGQGNPTRGKRIKIAIIDDHPLIREGLCALISRQPDLEVCGEADDVATGVSLVESTRPDVAIIDISLRDGNGLDLIRRIHTGRPEIRMLVASMYEEDLYAERALRAGAHGYIRKSEAAGQIPAAIRRIVAGQMHFSDRIAARLMQQATNSRPTPRETAIAALSDRELEIFKLIGEGLTTAQIAAKLHRSVKTIETHRQRMKIKLQLETTAELNREALHWMLEQR